jgi:hypothetical protein
MIDDGVGRRPVRRAYGRPPRDHQRLVETTSDFVAVAGDGVDAEGWLAEFDVGFAAIAGRFGRVEPRRQARAFLLGLLSDVNRVFGGRFKTP